MLIMCGADVFKEDRGWAGEMAMDEGLASLVMDGPGTGENPFPWDPASVKAWMAAIDFLSDHPAVDGGQARVADDLRAEGQHAPQPPGVALDAHLEEAGVGNGVQQPVGRPHEPPSSASRRSGCSLGFAPSMKVAMKWAKGSSRSRS